MKRLILCLIAVLFLSATASAEITFVLKDGSKVTWESYTETQTHYCKGDRTTNCIDKADVDAIREVIGGSKKGSSSQMIDDNSLKKREREMEGWEAQKAIDNEIQAKKDNLNKCLEQAKEKYHNMWNSECKTRHEKDGCNLYVEVAKSLDDIHAQDRSECYLQYDRFTK